MLTIGQPGEGDRFLLPVRLDFGFSVRRNDEWIAPGCAAVTGDVKSQFETTPDAKLVKGVSQVVLHHLFGRANYIGDFTISLALPNQFGDLNFLGG